MLWTSRTLRHCGSKVVELKVEARVSASTTSQREPWDPYAWDLTGTHFGMRWLWIPPSVLDINTLPSLPELKWGFSTNRVDVHLHAWCFTYKTSFHACLRCHQHSLPLWFKQHHPKILPPTCRQAWIGFLQLASHNIHVSEADFLFKEAGWGPSAFLAPWPLWHGGEASWALCLNNTVKCVK